MIHYCGKCGRVLDKQMRCSKCDLGRLKSELNKIIDKLLKLKKDLGDD